MFLDSYQRPLVASLFCVGIIEDRTGEEKRDVLSQEEVCYQGVGHKLHSDDILDFGSILFSSTSGLS